MKLRGLLLLPLLWLLAGCLISEQEGQLLPDSVFRGGGWDGRYGEVTIHFKTGYNQAILYGRSLALLLVGLWLIKAEKGARRRVFTYLFGVPLIAVAAWLLVTDWNLMQRYRIALRDDGLHLQTLKLDRDVEWRQIEGFSVLGEEYSRVGPKALRDNDQFWKGRIAEWKMLDLKLAGGETLTLDLTPLSVEQRETLWRGIAQRAGLVIQGS